ncbi:MAG: hypothetical protein ACYTCU_03995, partial [Planctomycetota bacterium]
RSLIFLVSDPLVRVWGWVFLVGLGGIVTAAFGLVGSLTAIFGLASMESEGVHVLWLVFAVGSAAFSAWVGLLLCQAALALRRTRDSLDTADFVRSQGRLRVYFIVQGVLMVLGLGVAVVTFAFVGLGALMDL